jgi:hypothetical protein
MTTRAEEYRARAEECDRHAIAAHDYVVRAQYRDLAQQWRELAWIAEQNTKTRPP